MRLNEGTAGNGYRVKGTSLPLHLAKRLEALGMTRDAVITIVNRKGRGIMVVKIRGTRFALGEKITEQIQVEAC